VCRDALSFRINLFSLPEFKCLSLRAFILCQFCFCSGIVLFLPYLPLDSATSPPANLRLRYVSTRLGIPAFLSPQKSSPVSYLFPVLRPCRLLDNLALGEQHFTFLSLFPYCFFFNGLCFSFSRVEWLPDSFPLPAPVFFFFFFAFQPVQSCPPQAVIFPRESHAVPRQSGYCFLDSAEPPAVFSLPPFFPLPISL